MIRKDYNDQIFRTETEKNKAIVSRLKCNQNSALYYLLQV